VFMLLSIYLVYTHDFQFFSGIKVTSKLEEWNGKKSKKE
jgi:hypothetical protein